MTIAELEDKGTLLAEWSGDDDPLEPEMCDLYLLAGAYYFARRNVISFGDRRVDLASKAEAGEFCSDNQDTWADEAQASKLMDQFLGVGVANAS